MKDLLAFMVKNIVDHPEEVQIKEILGERCVVLELRVAKSDMGKVLGRKGQNAKSLRTLLVAAAAKTGKRFVLEILE